MNPIARLSFAAFVATAALGSRAHAWDAGPARCKHDPCSGGVDTRTFPDTRPRYLKGKCPQGSRRTAISTCLHTVSWRGNTHLWVVNQAITLLGAGDAAAKDVAELMNAPACR